MIYQLIVHTLPDGLETQFTPPDTTQTVLSCGGRCELGISDSHCVYENEAVDLAQNRPLGVKADVYLWRYALACQKNRRLRATHRHRIDKYLDTLLANQTARKALPPTIAKSGNRKPNPSL